MSSRQSVSVAQTSGSEAPPQNSSPFDVRWRLFGIRFRITPSFWIMSALMGYLAMGLTRGHISFLGGILLWVGCTLISVLVHELGHVLMGRWFGQPGDITLAGLGGQAAGKYERLTNWQRIFVAAAGPTAGFLFLGLQIVVDSSQWNLMLGMIDLKWDLKVRWFLIDWINPELRWDTGYYWYAMVFLLLMNLFWNLLNLLPIYPMDGGMILREVCLIISPVGGLKFALGFSFLLASLVTLFCLVKVALIHRWLKPEQMQSFSDIPTLVDPHFGLLMFGMMAVQNFFYLRQATIEQRNAHYQDRDEE